MLHRSIEQQHYFNAPYQLAIAPDTLQGRIHSDRLVTLSVRLYIIGWVEVTQYYGWVLVIAY